MGVVVPSYNQVSSQILFKDKSINNLNYFKLIIDVHSKHNYEIITNKLWKIFYLLISLNMVFFFFAKDQSAKLPFIIFFGTHL